MLETQRLILRKWTEEEVGPITGWPPHKNVEESKNVIRNVLNGAECYAICRKENNIAIGSIELILNSHTDMTERDDECELGYWLLPMIFCHYIGMSNTYFIKKWHRNFITGMMENKA